MMNTTDNEIKNITPANLSQGSFPEKMDTANQFRAMNFFTLLIIALAMIPWIFGYKQILGFNVTGWSWVIGVTAALLICMQNMRLISFPLHLWLPWIGILLLYWFSGKDNPDANQSLVQLLSPLAVGCAASIFRPDSKQLEFIVIWITRLAWIAWLLLFVSMPMILIGVLPNYSFMAPQMIGGLLLGACYIAFYFCGSGRHLYYYLAMLAIAVVSLTRGPIIAMLSCLPLTPAPLTSRKRIILCAAMIICALFLFNSERIQQRMFYSGQGELTDLYLDNPNLATSGRSFMWDILWPGVEENPWLGNGFNMHRKTLINYGSILYLPHNDWLKLLYDMGIVGAGIYLIIMVLQMLSLIKIARWSSGANRLLAYGAATAFVPYALIMLTDNVILYVQFFGNLHFALIGIIYGALRREREEVFFNAS